MEKGDLDSKIKGISKGFKELNINKNLIDSLSTKIRKKLKEDNVKDMRDSFKNMRNSFKSKTPENKDLENPNLSDDDSSDDSEYEVSKAAKAKVKEVQEKLERLYKRAQQEGFKEGAKVTPDAQKQTQTQQQEGYSKGDRVIYNGTDEVLILGKHMENYPDIYYTIQFSDGREKQTVSEKLSPNVEEGPFSSDDEEVTGGKVKGGKNRTQKRGKKRLNRTLKN